MKKVFIGAVVLAIAGLIYAFAPLASKGAQASTAAQPAAEEAVKWYTWDEAIAATEKAPKKIFIDMYTDWCGWCKRMDATTFKDNDVAAYLNEHFYPVKFDAEQRGIIEYDGHSFKFIESGRRGVHELAYALLDGQLGYPSVVYLDEEQRRITVSPGFKPAEAMLKELRFIGGDHYKTTSFEQFNSQGGQ